MNPGDDAGEGHSVVLRTQLGGKFLASDAGLFLYKEHLAAQRIVVEFPRGDGIVAELASMALSFVPTPQRTLLSEELDYLRAIRRNPLHLVYNASGSNLGYMGEGTSIEVLFALRHLKPVVCAYAPKFSNTVPVNVRGILESRLEELVISNLARIPGPDLAEHIQAIIRQHRAVALTDAERQICGGEVLRLLRRYRDAIPR